MPKAKSALEFKGRLLSLTRVRVVEPDLPAIQAQLKHFARQMGQAVEGMPLVLESDSPVPLGSVLQAMRELGMQPIAAIEGGLTGDARLCGLPVLPADMLMDKRAAAAQPVEVTQPPPAPEPPAPPAPAALPSVRPTRIVTEPVRSGQQIYAEGSDLIVVQPVSAGAEIIADGCVHVYSALRGRAIAGARGDETARIFCRRMEADLLAVAGVYAVADQIQRTLRGHAVQVWLEGGKLRIEGME